MRLLLWLSRSYPDIVETMELETDTADYRTTPEGIELEILDADEKRLPCAIFGDEVALSLQRAVCPSAGWL